MLTVIQTALAALALIALADFVSGLIHWAEDAYGNADTPLLGRLVIRPNIVHHHFPRFFTRFSWLQSSGELLALGAFVLAGAWALDALTWHVWLFVAVSANANQIHKWAHRTRAENGRVISLLHDLRVLQSPRHHGLHHTDPKNTYYCPITNFVNPVLERAKFWPRLETLIERLTGLRHRDDTSVRGRGPGPAWLAAYRPLRPTSPEAAPAAPTVTPVPQTSGANAFRSTPVTAFTPPCTRRGGCRRCTQCHLRRASTSTAPLA